MNPKTVKEVLEELNEQAREYYHYNNGDMEENITQAQLHLDALYKARYLALLPEEKKNIGIDGDFEDGFNSAIQETKRRMNELL